MLIIPYEVDVPFDRRPVANWLLIGSILVVAGLQLAAAFDAAGGEATRDTIDEFVLDGYKLKGLFGHMWLHGGPFHVVGNLIFLWVFGNAVCQKMGNLLYLPVYLFVGLFAALAHVIFGGGLAVGASGAINGIIAVYLIFYPIHDISCFWFFWIFFYFRFGTFTISGFWMILLWLAFDIFGLVRGGGGVAYLAHLGGFAAGIGIGFVLLLTKLVPMDPDDDESLLQILTRGKKEEPTISRGRTSFEIRQAIDRKKYGALDGLPEPELGPLGLPILAPKAKPKPPSPQPKPQKASEPLVRFHCHCGQSIKMPAKYAGRTGKCPKCREKIIIPSAK